MAIQPEADPGRVPQKIVEAGYRPGLEDFLEALRVEAGLSRNTLAAYRRDITRFLGWAAERGVVRWEAIGPEEIVGHLAGLRASGAAEASVARVLSAVRMALRHQVSEGRLQRDPAALISSPILSRALPTTLSPEQVARLLAAPEGTPGRPFGTGRSWRSCTPPARGSARRWGLEQTDSTPPSA